MLVGCVTRVFSNHVSLLSMLAEDTSDYAFDVETPWPCGAGPSMCHLFLDVSLFDGPAGYPARRPAFGESDPGKSDWIPVARLHVCMCCCALLIA